LRMPFRLLPDSSCIADLILNAPPLLLFIGVLAFFLLPALLPIGFLGICVVAERLIGMRSRARDRRIQFRRARNLCIHCGYDLRESQGRCPECGMAMPGRAAPR